MMSDEDEVAKMQREAKLSMHKMFLEALRHREQDIIRFLAILGPALGGFIWLLGADMAVHPARFVAGTYGVLFVLVLGAFYSLALGYNYRYITLQLAKLESPGHINLEGTVLSSWPRWPAHFEAGNRWGVIPWCTPPGIIKVFWVAFLVCILGVTVIASRVSVSPGPDSANAAATQSTTQPTAEQTARAQTIREARQMKPLKDAIPWAGSVCFAIGLLWPVSVGRKMLRACRSEDPEDWKGRKTKEQDTRAGSDS